MKGQPMVGIQSVARTLFRKGQYRWATTQLVGILSSIVEVPHNDECMRRLLCTCTEWITVIRSVMCDVVARQNDVTRHRDDFGRQRRASSFHVAHSSIKKLGGAYAR